MKLFRNRLALVASVLLAGTASACTTREAGRELREAKVEDRPATIRCLGFHGVMYEGRSTGGPVYDVESGRLNFIDAETGALVSSEGECVVVSNNNNSAFTINDVGQVTRLGAAPVTTSAGN